jgi:hypothetical protein
MIFARFIRTCVIRFLNALLRLFTSFGNLRLLLIRLGVTPELLGIIPIPSGSWVTYILILTQIQAVKIEILLDFLHIALVVVFLQPLEMGLHDSKKLLAPIGITISFLIFWFLFPLSIRSISQTLFSSFNNPYFFLFISHPELLFNLFILFN